MRAYTREAAADVVRNGWILDIFLVTYSVNTVRTVHGVLKARMLKRLASPCSSGPRFVRTLHHDWRRKWKPTPVFLLRKSHGWWNLVVHSPWGRKKLDMTEQLHFLLWIQLMFSCLYV